MDKTETARAVVYTRVDRAPQDDFAKATMTVECQRDICRAAAKEHGLTIVAEYGDTTGAIQLLHRPGLQQLLAELPTLQVSRVVVSDIARISRNVRDLTAFEERLMRMGVALLVYGEGPAQTATRLRMTEILAEFSPGHASETSRVRDNTPKTGGRA